MNDYCMNCGAWKGLHRYDTQQCPKNGLEAPVGKIQEWESSVFEMDPRGAEDLLNQLSNTYAKRDLILIAKQDALPADVRKIIEDNEIAFQDRIEAVNAEIAELETLVKNTVIAAGATSKAAGLMAVFTKGRVSWDGKKLEGLMMVIPQLKDARKEGDPTVSIRKVG
jgi:hypothetical protein